MKASESYRQAIAELNNLESCRANPVAAGWASVEAWNEALKNAVLWAYECERIESAYDRAHEAAFMDATGQDLDSFYGID